MTKADLGLKGDRKRMEQIAARMRQWNLTHGRGCRTRAHAIARRMAVKRTETGLESFAGSRTPCDTPEST